MLNGKGVAASIVEGAKSQFDVLSDGKLVFSKQQQGRFPEEDEVVGLPLVPAEAGRALLGNAGDALGEVRVPVAACCSSASSSSCSSSEAL